MEQEEVIYLEPDEEITSVIDKMKNTPHQALRLVVPRGATLLQSVINLRLLVKEAESLSKGISIVTADMIGRNLASQVGLTVFASVQDSKPISFEKKVKPSSHDEVNLNQEKEDSQEVASTSNIPIHHFQEETIESPDDSVEKEQDVVKEDENAAKQVSKFDEEEVTPSKSDEVLKFEKPILAPKPQFIRSENRERSLNASVRKPSGSKKVLMVIFAIILILGLSAAYLLLPKADITLFVQSENLNKDYTLNVAEKALSDAAEMQLKGELIKITKEKSEKFSATGKKNIGEKAKGTITVYNSWDSNVRKYNAGAKFVADGKTFVSTGAFTLPGASLQAGSAVAGSVKVNIEAEQPGQEYNIGPGKFKILSLSAQEQAGIYAESTNALAGGLSKEVQVVSKTDYDNALVKLQNELNDEIEQEVKAQGKEVKMLQQAIYQTEPVVTSSKKVDEEADEFELRIASETQVMVFDQQELKAVLLDLLEIDVPDDKVVAIPSDEAIVINVEKLAYDKGEMDILVDVEAKVAPKIETENIANELVGKNFAFVRDYLQQKEGVEKITIDRKPAWWFNKLPDLARNIKVKIEYVSEN